MYFTVFFLMIYSDLTIKDKVLKIFTAVLLTNVNLRIPQTTRSISPNDNENDFLWGYLHRYFSGFKMLYRLGVIIS